MKTTIKMTTAFYKDNPTENEKTSNCTIIEQKLTKKQFEKIKTQLTNEKLEEQKEFYRCIKNKIECEVIRFFGFMIVYEFEITTIFYT